MRISLSILAGLSLLMNVSRDAAPPTFLVPEVQYGEKFKDEPWSWKSVVADDALPKEVIADCAADYRKATTRELQFRGLYKQRQHPGVIFCAFDALRVTDTIIVYAVRRSDRAMLYRFAIGTA